MQTSPSVLRELQVETKVDFHFLIREVLRKTNTVSSGGREHFAERLKGYFSIESY